jgi:hypothetical protein
MVIRFFVSNPIFYYKQEGSPMSEVPCLPAGMNRTFQYQS